MFQPPYRAAVIGRTGHGDYGHDVDLAFASEPKFKLVAVADDDPKGLAAAAKRLKLEHAYADYREMLDREKPQFVAVATRWLDKHQEMILACAERGIHVFCEKPLAPDLAQCDAIVSACERAHVKLAIAFQTRYSPRFLRVQEMIASGAIGEILELRSRGKEDKRGGGEDLMVLGVHLMDLARGLLDEPSWCFARVDDAGKPVTHSQIRDGAEGIGPLAGDRVDAIYGFSRTPAVAHFASTRTLPASSRFGMLIMGTKGCIGLRTGWLQPTYWLDDPTWTGAASGKKWVEITSAGPGKPETMGPDTLLEGNKVVVADLIHSVETDTQPRTSVYDGRAAVEMVLACYASHAKGGPVTLPLAERSRHPLLELNQAT